MKALSRTLSIFFLTILCSTTFAQKANYTTSGGLSIGFGAGAAYQRADLLNSKGQGFDFTLGSQIYQKEN